MRSVDDPASIAKGSDDPTNAPAPKHMFWWVSSKALDFVQPSSSHIGLEPSPLGIFVDDGWVGRVKVVDYETLRGDAGLAVHEPETSFRFSPPPPPAPRPPQPRWHSGQTPHHRPPKEATHV